MNEGLCTEPFPEGSSLSSGGERKIMEHSMKIGVGTSAALVLGSALEPFLNVILRSAATKNLLFLRSPVFRPRSSLQSRSFTSFRMTVLLYEGKAPFSFFCGRA